MLVKLSHKARRVSLGQLGQIYIELTLQAAADCTKLVKAFFGLVV